MELTHKTVLDLALALRGLDGTKEGTFKFGAKTRYALAKNLRILSGRTEDINKTRADIVRSIVPTGVISRDSAEAVQYDDAFTKFLDEKEEVPGLLRVKLSELNLEVNHIPVTILCALDPLIDPEA